MAEKSKPEVRETGRSRRRLPNAQDVPWFLQSQDPFLSETAQSHPHVFQNNLVQFAQPNFVTLPDFHDAPQHSYIIDTPHYQIEYSGDRDGSSARPGTPALPQGNFDDSYNSSNHRATTDQCIYVRKLNEMTSSNHRMQTDGRPSDLCQPQSPHSFTSFTTANQGNIARSLDGSIGEHCSFQDTRLSSSFHIQPSHFHQQNIPQHVQIASTRASPIYRFDHLPQQLQSLSLSDIDGNQPINNNFNHFPQNMVRLKNGGKSDDDDDQFNATNGSQFHEDGEGNHECFDLRQKSDTVGERDLRGNTPAPHLSDTPSMGQLDANHFQALGTCIHQSEWPMNGALWMSGPSSIGEMESLSGLVGDDTESIMSFSSSTAIGSARHPHQLGSKVEMVYSLLSMLGSSNREDMSRTLLEMSNNKESCVAMRQSGCLPLLVQLLHGADQDYVLSDQDPNTLRWALREARRRAGQALHNIVYAHPDDKRGRREARVLRLLEQIRDYSDYLRDVGSGAVDVTQNENLDLHPGPAIAALMKLSFDEEHRHAMCLLGGLQAIAELIQADYEIHANTNDQFCITVRRYAGMALTNLTFGDGTNKALLCSMKAFMQALVAQLHSSNEDLRQVTASVLRNLSWRADASSKQILREVDAVVTLMKTAMETSKESTLKSILSALWNLSAHCSVNKADICAIEGALEFLVSMLTYKSASKTLSIVENGGGILRNISSHIAIREDYRAILRKHNCLQTLLRHLKSPSLTVVSNACGTLWNLSARCQRDQQALWEMGAVGMLRNLIHSKHKMISMGSAAALKNLLATRPAGMGLGLGGYVENGHQNGSSQSGSPSLLVRKQRALEADIDQNLSETCDNIDSPKTSPNLFNCKKFTFDNNSVNKPQYLSYLPGRMYHSINGHVTSPLYVPRSESRDSLGSTRSEPPHYRAQRERFRIFVNTNRHLPLDAQTVQENASEWKEKTNLEHEDNTNIVMKLFQSLHTNSTHSNSHRTPSLPVNNGRPLKANNLTDIKRDTWEVSSREANKIENRNITCTLQNGFDEQVNASLQQMYRNRTDSPLNNEIQGLTVSPRHSLSNALRDRITHDQFNTMESSRTLQNVSIVDSGVFIHNKTFSNNANELVASEGNRLQRQVMDPILENVVLRRKPKSEMSHWSSTSTLKDMDNEETSIDQTSLAISRCSSLSSLTSCLQHSARNSWISDVSSRRTSGIISPSEIPDSPSDIKPRVSQFTDKAPDAETLGIPRPRPAWPLNVTPADFLGYITLPFDEDKPVALVTGQHASARSIGFSSPHEDTESALPKRPPNTPDKDICLSSLSSSSLENEDIEGKDGESTTRYINLGVPNNSNNTTPHNNNSKLHSRVNNLSSSFSYARSGIPVKSNNVRLTQSVPNVSRPCVLSSCAAGPLVPEMDGDDTNISKQYIGMSPLDEIDPMCDDNDNLLYEENEQKQYIKPGEMVQGKRKHNLKLLRKNIEATTKFPVHSQHLGLKLANKEHQNGKPHIYQDSFHSELEVMSPSSEQAEDATHSSTLYGRTKHARKPKTSIPQIVRPWQSGFDGEVHPKQLQIMSQNLPVYRGGAPMHHGEKEGNQSKDKVSNELRRQSDPSSFSADSEVSSTELLQEGTTSCKPPRVKAKRNKLFRRSTEIATSDHSSDEDNRNDANEQRILLDSLLLVQHSEGERKGKEDERTREKFTEMLMKSNAIPDLLEGATFHTDFNTRVKRGVDCRQFINVKMNGTPRTMTDSMELRKGAFMVTAELDELADDQTHSSASYFSDLDNMKPPSLMGEMSMTSSGLSDLLSNGNGNGKCYINGKAAVDRRRSLKRIKKINGSQRFVFKSVIHSRDVSRSIEHSDKPSSLGGSVENLSMRSSTSELLDNINPPSVMDDISMTNSCTSLNSINSDILESRSQSLADARSDSEMFQRLNAAAAMVQVYSRELNTIMTGSMKSSCNSDNLDQVKPPSVFQDIAEVTVEDGTEVGSDAMISDSELEEEELPHDDDASMPTIATVDSPLHMFSRTERIESSTENLNSSFEGDSICATEKTHQSIKRISRLALTPQSSSIIKIDCNTVQHTSNSFVSDDIEDGASNLPILNDTLKDQVNSPTPVRRGPRIVKPINRETIRQMQEKKAQDKPVRSIRGRVPAPSRTSLRGNGFRPTNLVKSINAKKNSVVSTVRPTRTSALRASQSQKQADIRSSGRTSPRAFLSKPPSIKSARNLGRSMSSSSNGAAQNSASNAVKNKSSENQKPLPPIKQGTFTKDEPTQRAPAISTTISQDQKSDVDDFAKMSQSQCSFSSQEHTRNWKDGSDSCMSPTISAKFKLMNKKSSDNVPNVQRNSSNNRLKRIVGISNQTKESPRTIKSSPSSHSFGDDQESEKHLGNTNSKSVTLNRSSLSSLSSSNFSVKRANSQKEITSKISSIWKKSESSSSANSPVTDSSITERLALSAGKSKQISMKLFSRSMTSNNLPVQETAVTLDAEKPKPDVLENIKKSLMKSTSTGSRVGFLSIQNTNMAAVRKKTAFKSQEVAQAKPISKVISSNSTSASTISSISKGFQRSNVQRSIITKAHESSPMISPSANSSVTNFGVRSDVKSVGMKELKMSPMSVMPFNYTPSGSKSVINDEFSGMNDDNLLSGEKHGENSENINSPEETENNYLLSMPQ